MNTENKTQDQPQAGTATAIVTANPLALVNSLEGFENVTIAPTQMSVIQNTKRDVNDKSGHFKDMVTGQHYKTVNIVLLNIQVDPGPRVLYEEGSEFGSDPICRSNDGIRPSDNAKQPQHPTCAGCPNASWKDWKSGGKPPKCKENARLLFAERESGLPYYITLKGKSVGQVKILKNAIVHHCVSVLGKLVNKYRTGNELELLTRYRNAGMDLEAAKIATLKDPSLNVGMSKVQAEQAALKDPALLQIYDFTTEMYLQDTPDPAHGSTYYIAKFRAPGEGGGFVGRVRTIGEFAPLFKQLSRVVPEEEQELTVVPEGRVTDPVPSNQVVDAEVVPDDEIPF